MSRFKAVIPREQCPTPKAKKDQSKGKRADKLARLVYKISIKCNDLFC